MQEKLKVNNFSAEMQDVAAALLLGVGGKYLDLGAASAQGNNNTYLLKKRLNWDGMCVDLRREESGFEGVEGETYEERGSILHTLDCTTSNFLDALKENSMPKIIDYVSLDVDVASIPSLLNLIEEGGYIFKFLTYEHDFHYSRNHELWSKNISHGKLNETGVYENQANNSWPHSFSKESIESRKFRSKDFLQKKGYFLLFENVSFEIGGILHPMEDWWINPQYFPEFVTQLHSNGSHFADCIKKLASIISILHNRETQSLIKESCFESVNINKE
mgnify:FL=1|tara:strand:+ start:200 stop:1024 length:825 start_codon:yes stop_codon:yes gene_type:complete